MTKRIIRFSLFLAFVIGCILFIQWKGYHSVEDAAVLNIEQTFTIRHTQDEFVIKQSIENLPEGKYHIHYPPKAKDIDCQLGEDHVCKWEDGKNSQLKVKEGPLTFTYKLKAPMKVNSFLLEDWGITIKEAPSASTRIQLTEQNWRNGSWATGADLAGKEKMEGLDYYVFKAEGLIPPLFWQEQALVPMEMNQHLTIYSEGKPSLKRSIFEKLVPDEKIFVIMSNNISELTETDKLIFVPGGKKNVEKQLASLLLAKKLSFTDEKEWMLDLLVSSLTHTPAHSNKVEKMRETIFSVLTKEQADRWLENILSTDSKTITSQLLDELLEDTAGIKTDFFQKNADMSKPFQPFYFLDKRKIYINGKKADKINILLQNDRTYISFVPLIEMLGFHVLDSSKPKELMIGKNGDKYHFIFSKKLFFKNGQQFGFQRNPFSMDHNEVYFDTAALKGLFDLEVEENSQEINIH
ncbi:hypothetical protein D5F11_005830 [Siminovitchia terrae]|uniref:Copper amine oxidase-like N-terminal domain-containing protein n=1 Tax=Siminovitchia terrae TaxID=1914933 RepID=A0A429XD01_SIMTE|nr:stalk domain-containing protein [Siminovitchia terrae]RST60863.1 hypothetical protein D5F11_005830 [Siminovitchia terrae]